MINKLFMLSFVLILLPANSYSSVYKWKDEHGKIQYSDKNSPENNSRRIKIKTEKKTKINHNYNTDLYVSNNPIIYNKSIPSKNLIIQKIYYEPSKKLNSLSYIKDQCNPKRYSFNINKIKKDIKNNHMQLIKQAHNKIRDLRYSSDITIDSKDINHSGIYLKAQISSIQFNLCFTNNIETQKGYMKVKWDIYEQRTNNKLITFTTQGSTQWQEQLQRTTYQYKKIEQAMKHTLNHNIDILFSKNKFVDFLDPESSLEQIKARNNIDFIHMNLNILYSDDGLKFIDKVENLKKATVTVKTKGGHGSGFILTPEGHVITNYHVIKKNKNVTILVKDNEFEATVLRIDEKRDTALLKINKVVYLHSVKISKKRPKVSEELFIIGTPLFEYLHHTITKGILSANRIINDQQFYQTDASVNKGNSGGPAFNEHGEVIGIAVSGFYNKRGTSLNINYLIPIDDVFDSLSISSQNFSNK